MHSQFLFSLPLFQSFRIFLPASNQPAWWHDLHRLQIVDRAWALIVERHPELDTSVADEARAAAEIDLKRSCPPSVRLRNPHPPLLLEGGCPVAGTSTEIGKGEGASENRESPNQPAQGDDENGNDANADADGNVGSGDGGGSGGVTVLQWDPLGEVCQRTYPLLQAHLGTHTYTNGHVHKGTIHIC